MCTVSFISHGSKTIITSNRDEAVARPAVEPASYLINNCTLIFPKDPLGGGTWFAVDEKANVAVLLNGASEKHSHKGNYRKSRGLITLDIIATDNALKTWQDSNLDNIEPFTVVLFFEKKLYQLRWNGTKKEKMELDDTKNHIWSSATLYPKEVREARSKWFYGFLDTMPEISETEIFNFHRYTRNEDEENGLVVNHNGMLKTLSITQAVIQDNKTTIAYNDLLTDKEYSNSFIIL